MRGLGFLGVIMLGACASPAAPHEQGNVDAPTQAPQDAPVAPDAPAIDPCTKATLGDGVYCGSSLSAGDPNTLYTCANMATTMSQVCQYGCFMAPNGVPDSCNPKPGSISIQRGIDRAGVLSPGEATSYKNAHNATWSGVYMGGPCNGGSGWTRAAVTAIYNATQWSFMPIYVGQQSPAICGASTLTYASGHSDGTAAAGLMGQFNWGPNKKIPVALDLEAGTYSFSPSGATSYVHGWVDAVHSAGYLAYVYSSPAALDAMTGLPIDGVWVANWYYTDFANVLPSDSRTGLGSNYPNHQRAWQYSGCQTCAVDWDVSDLLLAPAPGGSNI
jgi:hypothetical protein